MDGILILHNSFGSPDDPLYASRIGVMDQVGAVKRALDSLGMEAEVAAIEDLNHLIQLLKICRQSLVFNLIEEFIGSIEQANYVPAICRAFGKSATGCDTPTLLIAQKKGQAKALLQGAGLPCPDGAEIRPGRTLDAVHLPAGCYVLKPAWNDASEGISSDSVVSLPSEKDRAQDLLSELHRRFQQPVIVERFIASRELNVSLMDRKNGVEVLTIAEISFSAFEEGRLRIVDYSAKWDENSFLFKNTPRKIPADLDRRDWKRIEELALSAWNTLGCRDYARVDFRLDEQDRPYILEVNPNPDISPDAGFAAALRAAEISYGDFVRDMLSNAGRRLEKAVA